MVTKSSRLIRSDNFKKLSSVTFNRDDIYNTFSALNRLIRDVNQATGSSHHIRWNGASSEPSLHRPNPPTFLLRFWSFPFHQFRRQTVSKIKRYDSRRRAAYSIIFDVLFSKVFLPQHLCKKHMNILLARC